MSLISNIGILQNPEAKKAFSKLSFEVGEWFSARIVSTDEQSGEVNLKLLDGWQFSAKLHKPLEQYISGSVLKFEVEGFEQGKLIIKLVGEGEDKQGKASEFDVLEDLTKGKSLSHNKMDSLLFEKMIKHDMPLTKENIINIKNLVHFREKISLDSNKEEIFIAKYLDSRNVDPGSEKSNDITKTLKNFFEALKNLEVDDILLFKENNIELNKGNLDSFTKLFKGESAVYNNLKDINKYYLNSDLIKNMLRTIEPSSIVLSGNNFEMDDSNEIVNLKNFEIKDDLQEESPVNVESANSTKQVKTPMIANYDNRQIVDKTENLSNPIVNNNSKEVVNIKELLNFINIELKDLNIENRVLKFFTKNLDLKQENGNFNIGTIKTLVDKIFKAEGIILSPDGQIKLLANLEEKLRTIDVSNRSGKLEVVQQGEKLPLSDVQKDMTNEIELINKNATNSKASGYSKNNSLNEIVNMIKKELNFEDIERVVVNKDISNIQKITTDLLVKEQIGLKTEEIINIVKTLLENKLNIKPEAYEKIMDVFKQNINDIKLFNSISEQYYYLDLPIKVKENEYQCKLIIKDDRKKGKKIDSKNVNIATSVKTINMGTVDAYIKINNNNMKIDINCDKFWVSVFDLGKEKLIRNLSSLNYKVNIEVNNRSNEFTLASCREFFDDRNFNTLDIKV